MRLVILVVLLSVSVSAQQPAGRGGAPAATPQNLKVLAPDTDIPFAMQMFNQALGVQCIYCHVQGDLAIHFVPVDEITAAPPGVFR